MASAGTQEEATSGPLVSDSVGLLPTPPPMTGKPGEEDLSPNPAPTFSGRKLSLSSLSFVEISPKYTQVCQENQGQAGLWGPWQPRCGPWDELLTQTFLPVLLASNLPRAGPWRVLPPTSCPGLVALPGCPPGPSEAAGTLHGHDGQGAGGHHPAQPSPRFKGPLHGHHPGNQTACPSEMK